MIALPASITRGLIRVLCAFLLVAQQAGLIHVVAHAAAETQASVVDGAHEPERAPAPELATVCAFDVAFGQVLGGGPATHHAAPCDAASSQAAFHRRCFCTTADGLTPRSRGPPVLL